MRRGPIIDEYAERIEVLKEKLKGRAGQVKTLRAKVYELDEACKRKDALIEKIDGYLGAVYHDGEMQESAEKEIGKR